MEDQATKINFIIDLINQNIQKIETIEFGEDYYIIKEKLSKEKQKHFNIKIKEDIELNQIDIALKKLEYSKNKISNNENNKKNIEKLIIIYQTRKNLILSNRHFRLNIISNLESKLKETNEEEKKFYKTKNLIILTLNQFIKSIKFNNIQLKNYYNFTSFTDNKDPIDPKVLEYFKPLGVYLAYDTCLVFESTLDSLINLLTTNDIRNILLNTPIITKSKNSI